VCRRSFYAVGCIAALLGMATAHADEASRAGPRWPDTATSRLEALALLQGLNAILLSNSSATLTLDQWCEAHHLAASTKIVAERDPSVNKPPTHEIRELLKVSETEPVRYRHVRLLCGEHVLSEADNWYVPARLSPSMNVELDTTNVSFGRVVQSLKFERRTLTAKLLWSPLPAGWEMGSELPASTGALLAVPPYVLEHQAVLTLPDGSPFSALIESYTRELLAFPPPPSP
jgi:chorismate-pyruvate lyase